MGNASLIDGNVTATLRCDRSGSGSLFLSGASLKAACFHSSSSLEGGSAAVVLDIVVCAEGGGANEFENGGCCWWWWWVSWCVWSSCEEGVKRDDTGNELEDVSFGEPDTDDASEESYVGGNMAEKQLRHWSRTLITMWRKREVFVKSTHKHTHHNIWTKKNFFLLCWVYSSITLWSQSAWRELDTRATETLPFFSRYRKIRRSVSLKPMISGIPESEFDSLWAQRAGGWQWWLVSYLVLSCLFLTKLSYELLKIFVLRFGSMQNVL